MSNELVVKSNDEMITILRSSIYPGAAKQSIVMALEYCAAQGLDVMMKPVHIVPMWDGKAKEMRDVIMPGIGLYRIQASRTGQFAGMTETEFGPVITQKIGGVEVTYPEWAKVTVKRLLPNGMIAEFTAREYWLENYAIKGGQEKSVAPNAMWSKRVYGQISKCAQAQALRMAFPELGAAPTAEEMEGKMSIIDNDAGTSDRTDSTQRITTLPNYTDADMQKNTPAWRDFIQSGKRTPDQIIAMVSSKYVLSDEQKTVIRDLNLVDAEIISDSRDEFLADMERAENANA